MYIYKDAFHRVHVLVSSLRVRSVLHFGFLLGVDANASLGNNDRVPKIVGDFVIVAINGVSAEMGALFQTWSSEHDRVLMNNYF